MSLKRIDCACIGIGVYAIESGLTGASYVGSSKHVQKRLQEHATALKNNRHYNRGLQREFNLALKSGQQLDTASMSCGTREDAFNLEQQYIDDMFEEPWCLNRSKDARYCSVDFSPEHRTNISRAKKAMGLKMSPEHRQKLNKIFTGRALTGVHKQRISQANLGKKMSPESIEKLRQANLGRKMSAASIAKLRQSKIGVSLSAIHREHISAARKGIVFSENHRKNLSKANTGRIISDAQRAKVSIKSTLAMQVPAAREHLRKSMLGNQHALGTVRSKESMVASTKATSKPIIADGVWYASGSEASRQTGLASGTIHNRLNSPAFPSWAYAEMP